ncbi:hypothetical protein DXC92_17350 [Clostridiales bacterium TF09-2AC]|nr:hypothetical protein DXC92_17350 [Clostridiales bacterium TF09-2AC]
MPHPGAACGCTCKRRARQSMSGQCLSGYRRQPLKDQDREVSPIPACPYPAACSRTDPLHMDMGPGTAFSFTNSITVMLNHMSSVIISV